MKVKVLITFFDRQARTWREVGDIIDVASLRAKELEDSRFGKLVEPVKQKVQKKQDNKDKED